MYDYQLFTLIKGVVDAGLTAAGIDTGKNPDNTSIGLTQSYQPNQEGVSLVTQVFCQKVGGDKRYGFKKVEEVWNQTNGNFDHIETQVYESTFQFGAVSILDVGNVQQLTASDILKIVSASMQSDSTIDYYNSQGVGILRITDIRNIYFKNDKDNYQASPSFDCVLTHRQVTITSVPKADPIEGGIFPV